MFGIVCITLLSTLRTATYCNHFCFCQYVTSRPFQASSCQLWHQPSWSNSGKLSSYLQPWSNITKFIHAYPSQTSPGSDTDYYMTFHKDRLPAIPVKEDHLPLRYVSLWSIQTCCLQPQHPWPAVVPQKEYPLRMHGMFLVLQSSTVWQDDTKKYLLVQANEWNYLERCLSYQAWFLYDSDIALHTYLNLLLAVGLQVHECPWQYSKAQKEH